MASTSALTIATSTTLDVTIDGANVYDIDGGFNNDGEPVPPLTFPRSITSNTTYYVERGSLIISLRRNGLEVATTEGKPNTELDMPRDAGATITPTEVAQMTLTYDTPVTLSALNEAATHTFGSLADSVVIFADQTTGAFDGTLHLEQLRTDGTWGGVNDAKILINGFSVAQPNDWTSDGDLPRVVRRDGLSQIRLRVSGYTSGTVTVTCNDLPSASRVAGSHDGNNFADNVGVFIDNYDPVPVSSMGLVASGNAPIAATNDEADFSAAENITIQIEGTCDGDFLPEFTIDATNWHAVSLDLITDIATGTHPAALVNGGIYKLDIAGAIPSFRIRGDNVTSGSSVVHLYGRTAVS